MAIIAPYVPVTNTPTAQNTTTQTSSSQGLDPQSMKLLQSLIAQLQGGGTGAQQGDRVARTQATVDTQNMRNGYTKEAAVQDSQAVMAAQMREALAKVLPQITRSAEGAGTSQNSMRALLTQKAAGQAADQSAALGMKAVADYGQINTGMGQLLQALTTGTDPVQAALLQAFSTLKGANTLDNKSTTAPQGQTASSGGGGTYGGLGSYSAPSLGESLRTPNNGGMSLVGNSQTYQSGLSNPGTGGYLPNEALSNVLASYKF